DIISETYGSANEPNIRIAGAAGVSFLAALAIGKFMFGASSAIPESNPSKNSKKSKNKQDFEEESGEFDEFDDF
ncbi:MAG: hypothetical protein CMA12_04490, partial [Euryarchaeota archaeon]|nr:hypothetical protein [Euryarchaeota archaeon]